MSVFFKVVVAFTSLAVLGVCCVAVLILDDDSAVVGQESISPASIQRTLSFIEAADPRALPSGTYTSLVLREQDLDLILSYILESSGQGAGNVSVDGELITVLGSMKAPPPFLGRYLNLQFVLAGENSSLHAKSVQLGNLRLPEVLTRITESLLHWGLKKWVPEYAEVSNAVTGYKIADGNLVISYRWQPELLQRLSTRGSALFIDEEERERVIAYMLKIAEIAADDELPRNVSLAQIFVPIFAFAALNTGDPVKENRAAIIALAIYVMEIDVSQLIEDSGAIPEIERHNITLSGRLDFAKHFLSSAAIAIGADTSIASSFGLIKEIDDASAGSGFSFTDVGADRAGIRFAEFATSSPQNAVLLQRKLSSDSTEALFIPPFADLPEFMPEKEFVARYGGPNQPEFERVMVDIEERISQLPLFTLQ